MSTVTADSLLRNWLGQLEDVTEIRDASGKLLGVFTPSSLADEMETYQQLRQLFDPGEADRILAEQHGKGRPLAEIWKDLNAREHSS